MKRVAFLVFISITLLFSQTTKEKIDATSKEIGTKEKEQKTLSLKVDELGNQILKESKNLKDTDKKIDEITGLVVNLSEKHKLEEEQLDNLNIQTIALADLKKELEEKIVDMIANDFSFNLIQDNDIKTAESVLSNEIFASLNIVLNDELANLLKEYEKTTKEIEIKSKEIAKIESNLKEYSAKKIELSNEKKKKETLVANLSKNRESYISRLEKNQRESEALAKTLAELNIINDKEEREKARLAEEKRVKAEEEKRKKEASKKKTAKKESVVEEPVVVRDQRVDDIDKKVKLYGSSYQESRVRKYSGSKTISPLKNAIVKRKFGNFTDPVYGIKIFNESVILTSDTYNAQVYNVLDGKVIFAKKTPVLDNVIIVESSSGIHTIYANLSQIAPTIKNGSVIKKGYAIGRVEKDLTFEVTQKNYHINPLEMISLK
ncbi:MAG: peptidoglycan DD-metalloendopeptidase family protein [Campylobacteraceae bacterium]|nr:peptidoglycan DD-metalloendopeptidase family protein [Campylobacteraceae bacterium]